MSATVCKCGQSIMHDGSATVRETVCPHCKAPIRISPQVAQEAASRWVGMLWGTLLLLTLVFPWGVSGGRPVWSWRLFDRWPVAASVTLIGAWLAGLVVLGAGVSVRGLRLAVVYLLAAGAAVALYLVATEASPIPWLVFVPVVTRHEWLQVTAVAALAFFVVVTGVRIRGGASVSGRVFQCLASLVVMGMAISVGGDAVQRLSGAAGRPWAVILDLTVAALVVVGCLLTLLQALSFNATGSRMTTVGRRLVLTGLLLLFVRGIADPVMATPEITGHALCGVLGRLNSEILLAGIALVTIEGLIGVCAHCRYALIATAAALVSGVAVAVSVQPRHVAPVAQQVNAAAAPQHSNAVAVRAGDWPQWCGRADRNMVSDEKGLPDRCDAVTSQRTSGLTNVKWVVPLGVAHILGSPVVCGGKVFLGGQGPRGVGVLWCFRESDGQLLWRMVSPYPSLLYNRHSYGICATPTVEGDRVYLLGHLGDVLCLSASGMAGGNQGPFVDEARYFASEQKRVTSEIAPDGTRILECTPGVPATLSSMDADILWRFDLLRKVNCWPFNAVNAAIVVRGDRLYVATCSTLSEYADDGSAERIREWKKKYQKTAYDSPSLIVLDKNTGKLLARDREGIFEQTFHGAHASPTLGTVNGKELLFYGAGNGVCYAFDPECSPGPDGKPGALKLVWKFDCLAAASYGSRFRPDRLYRAETIATPVFYNNRIYTSIGNDLANSGPATGPGRLVCIDATQTGDITATGRIWSFDDMQSTASTVAIGDGLLYTADAGGAIYCLDADTGKLYWKYETAPVWSSPLLADGKVYIGTHNRGLLVFAHGREGTLLSTNLGTADIVASPAVANGVLYIASQRHLYALESGKAGSLVEHGN
ncbi:MAG: PQQ-binding-like beta-propeller repeat protein [Planctomycetota bacterium]|nr:PQQ-binding-like beta-propeller repeat protein [Planctomycetota bacterium]